MQWGRIAVMMMGRMVMMPMMMVAMMINQIQNHLEKFNSTQLQSGYKARCGNTKYEILNAD